MAFPSGQYSRDPLEQLIYKESLGCKGCKHRKTIPMFGSIYELCELDKKVGKRCKNYTELQEMNTGR